MSDRDPATHEHRDTTDPTRPTARPTADSPASRQGGAGMTPWIIAGAAAVILILAVFYWNGSNNADDVATDGAPTIEEQAEATAEDPAEAAEEATADNVTNEVGDALQEAGRAITAGPENPVAEVTPEEDAVADEAARENQIIEQNADADPQQNSPVTDAQRTADQIESGQPTTTQ